MKHKHCVIRGTRAIVAMGTQHKLLLAEGGRMNISALYAVTLLKSEIAINEIRWVDSIHKEGILGSRSCQTAACTLEGADRRHNT